jgi:hypothetical protein
MITFIDIGAHGRLGNQMFQFASTYGIAKKLGYDVAFPLENITTPSVEDFKDGITREVYFDIPNVFEIPKELLKPKSDIVYNKEAQEPYFHFSPDLFTIPDSTNIKGYYQTEKYFEHCKNEILDIFTFKSHIKRKALELFPKVITDTVGIHVRVGDYAGLQMYHPICEPDYYASAMTYFTDKNYYFLIFSDNIDYCKDIFGESENIIYICNNEPEVDMCLMSMCEHNVIANSTFSWWAAWLNKNPNKKVIAPKKWFGPAYEGVNNTKDIYCQNFKIV